MVQPNYWLRKSWKMFGYNDFLWWEDSNVKISTTKVKNILSKIKDTESLKNLEKKFNSLR